MGSKGKGPKETKSVDEIIKPVEFAKEKGIRPQMVFGWIRNGSVPVEEKDEKGRGWKCKRSALETRYQKYMENAQKRAEKLETPAVAAK